MFIVENNNRQILKKKKKNTFKRYNVHILKMTLQKTKLCRILCDSIKNTIKSLE